MIAFRVLLGGALLQLAALASAGDTGVAATTVLRKMAATSPAESKTGKKATLILNYYIVRCEEGGQ